MGVISDALGKKKPMMGMMEDDMGAEEPSGEEDDMDEAGKADAAKLVLKAIKSNDATALASAISDLVKLC